MTNTFTRSPQYLLTSESVTEGHPDKLCDQVSDAILDAILAKDPAGRVACETAVTTGLVVVMGEITTKTYVDIPQIVRDTVQSIGYTNASYGIELQHLRRHRIREGAITGYLSGGEPFPGDTQRLLVRR